MTTTQIAARLPADLVSEIDRTATEDVRGTRTDQLEYLLRIGIAGRKRLKDFEDMATAILAAPSPTPNTAGADHLRRHADLSGLAPPSDKDNS